MQLNSLIYDLQVWIMVDGWIYLDGCRDNGQAYLMLTSTGHAGLKYLSYLWYWLRFGDTRLAFLMIGCTP